MAKNKKSITIEDLAETIEKGFSETRKEFIGVRKEFENLAIMTHCGFEETATKKEVSGLDTKIDGLKIEITELKSEIMTLRHDFDEFKSKINKLEVATTDFIFKIQDFEKRIKRIEMELKLK